MDETLHIAQHVRNIALLFWVEQVQHRLSWLAVVVAADYCGWRKPMVPFLLKREALAPNWGGPRARSQLESGVHFPRQVRSRVDESESHLQHRGPRGTLATLSCSPGGRSLGPTCRTLSTRCHRHPGHCQRLRSTQSYTHLRRRGILSSRSELQGRRPKGGGLFVRASLWEVRHRLLRWRHLPSSLCSVPVSCLEPNTSAACAVSPFAATPAARP